MKLSTFLVQLLASVLFKFDDVRRQVLKFSTKLVCARTIPQYHRLRWIENPRDEICTIKMLYHSISYFCCLLYTCNKRLPKQCNINRKHLVPLLLEIIYIKSNHTKFL